MDRRRRVGGYILREQIRAGSKGAVFRSGSPFGRLAVTVVPGDSLPAEAFRSRAEAVAGLRHKCIVPLYDFGADDGCLYFVTKFVDGETLADSLTAEGRLPPVEAAEIASDILGALSAVHLKGFVHGGLTPSSILVSAWSRAMLTDLAIPSARALGDSVDDTPDEVAKAAAGSRASRYSPPEQLRGGDPDDRWDIYSIGAILFEMLTGTKPARPGGGGSGEFATEWPPTRIEAVTPALEASVLKALSPQPSERFSTAAEMRAALHASSRRRSALGEALGPEVAPGPRTAAPTRPPGPKASPRHALPTAGLKVAGPKAAEGSPGPRGRAATRSSLLPGIRRQYKHRGGRRAEGFFQSGRWRPVALAVALGVGAILVLFALFVLSMNVFLEDEGAAEQRSAPEVSTDAKGGQQSTPFLSGKTVEAAMADLDREGLRLGEISSEPSDSVAPDHILDQSPAGGTRVARGASVDLVVAVEPSNR